MLLFPWEGAELTEPWALVSPQRFLSDYGLQWVGEPMDQENSEDRTGPEDHEKDWMMAKKFWKPGRIAGAPEPSRGSPVGSCWPAFYGDLSFMPGLKAGGAPVGTHTCS